MSAVEDDSPPSLGSPLENVDLLLSSTLDSLAEVETEAEAIALRAGFDEDTASTVAMVTREATINAVKHGNRFAPDKTVRAILQRSSDAVLIRISDQGESFDPAALPDPLDERNLLRDSGRGVFLMRALMDEVHFRQLRPGTEVTLIKRKQTEASI